MSYEKSRCMISALFIDFCKTKLASYKKPKSVEFMDELPKSAVGKIIRRVLKEPYWNDYQRQI